MKKMVFCFVLCLLVPALAFAEFAVDQEMPIYGLKGGRYTGPLVDGLPTGYGCYVMEIDEEITWVYTGEFRESFLHGEGLLQRKETGEFLSGRFEISHLAEGRMTSEDGKYIYEGVFTGMDNSATGSGKVYDTKGTLIFEGTFENEILMEGTLYNIKTGEPAATGTFGKDFIDFIQDHYIPGYIYY